MKIKELREQSPGDLQKMLRENRAFLFSTRDQSLRERNCEKPHLFTGTRKQNARILTVLREKEGAK